MTKQWCTTCCAAIIWGQSTAKALLTATQIPQNDYFEEMAMHYFRPNDGENPYHSPPPLKYSPKDYTVMAEMWNQQEDGVPNEMWFSVAIPGEDVPEFFRDAKMQYTLEEPVLNVFPETEKYGTFENYVETYANAANHDLTVGIELRGSLKVMRKPDRKCITITDATYYGHLDSDISDETVPCFQPHGSGPDNCIQEDHEELKFQTSMFRGFSRGDQYDPEEVYHHIEPTFRLRSDCHAWKIDVVGFEYTGEIEGDEANGFRKKYKNIQFAHILEWNAACDTAKNRSMHQNH